MHEATIAENLLEVVRLRLGAEPAGAKAKSIAVRIGEFRSVDSEMLRTAFNSLKANRPGAENCELAIETVEAKAECPACKTVFKPRPVELYRCSCGADTAGKVSQGLELQVLRCLVEGENE